jgi:hypothetical protein
MHESGYGPSRHIAPPRQFGRYRCKADINERAGLDGSVAIDPLRKSVPLALDSARNSSLPLPIRPPLVHNCPAARQQS